MHSSGVLLNLQALPVMTKQGRVLPTDPRFTRRYFLFYFSAHWCPPCRAFTPKLAAFYERNKATHNFEVLFITLDKDQASFDEYFKSMPDWLAMEFDSEITRNRLAKEMGVEVIPTLIVLDRKGMVVTRAGKYMVEKDPTGANFPWMDATEPPSKFTAVLAAVVVIVILGCFLQYIGLFSV